MRQILAPDAIFGTQGITQEDKDYHGSRFSDVKEVDLTNAPHVTGLNRGNEISISLILTGRPLARSISTMAWPPTTAISSSIFVAPPSEMLEPYLSLIQKQIVEDLLGALWY
jgi:hypothetical protein